MKKVIKRIGQFFKKLFSDGFGFLRNNSEIAVKVVNIIKDIVESPLAPIVVDWTKTEVDDALLPVVKEKVNEVAIKIGIAHGILQVDADNSDALEKLIDYIRGFNEDLRIDFWLRLSGEFNMALADGKITFAEAVALAQFVYVETKS